MLVFSRKILRPIVLRVPCLIPPVFLARALDATLTRDIMHLRPSFPSMDKHIKSRVAKLWLSVWSWSRLYRQSLLPSVAAPVRVCNLGFCLHRTNTQKIISCQTQTMSVLTRHRALASYGKTSGIINCGLGCAIDFAVLTAARVHSNSSLLACEMLRPDECAWTSLKGRPIQWEISESLQLGCKGFSKGSYLTFGD